jgi:hypothetical protein
MPPWQRSPGKQLIPQPPQLSVSVIVLTHVPAHDFSLPVHAAQLPPRQVWPAGHRCPQLPQFAASTRTFTQRPPHAVCPPGHVAEQIAPKQ